DAAARANAEAAERGAASLATRAELRLAAVHAVRESAAAVDAMYSAGGATSIYSAHPLQRHFRDVHAATQHVMLSPTAETLGGRGVAVRCDHAVDADVEALFARVDAEAGRLDVLVNNAFAIPDGPLVAPFWELPIAHWDTMHSVGLRSHYVAAVHAARRMVR